jgi:HEAT repeat protein
VLSVQREDFVTIVRAGLLRVFILMALIAIPGRVSAQTVSSESAALAQGWALVAKGDAAGAMAIASDLVTRYPRSAAVLAFVVEAAIARGGSAAGLDAYEHWLGKKTAEDGYALRRVAHALLKESVTAQDRRVRLLAVQALQADGDSAADAALRADAPAGAQPDRPAGSSGEAKSVDALIATAQMPVGNRSAAIAGLAKSGSPRATKALFALLSDPDPVVRAAAADAVGSSGRKEAIPQLKRLLNDPVFTVHLSAAGALLALDDTTGLTWLRDLQGSEHAGIRLAAAQVLKDDADANWMDTVRALTTDRDPEIRRQAAELIAPHDPAAAERVLEPMLQDPNPAQREAARGSFIRHVASDFAALRPFLRSSDHTERVEAAGRILLLTR